MQNKTHNLILNLMSSTQLNKEITYNETISKIDMLCTNYVDSFISSIANDKPKSGQKYIITNQDQKNMIAYAVPNKTWQLFQPIDGMIVFVKSESQFYYFHQNYWKKLYHQDDNFDQKDFHFNSIHTESDLKKLLTIPANKKYYYISLDNNISIDLSKVNSKSLVIIIKLDDCNNYIDFIQKIIWCQACSLKDYLSNTLIQGNKLILIKLYKLPENNEFLGTWQINTSE